MSILPPFKPPPGAQNRSKSLPCSVPFTIYFDRAKNAHATRPGAPGPFSGSGRGCPPLLFWSRRLWDHPRGCYPTRLRNRMENAKMVVGGAQRRDLSSSDETRRTPQPDKAKKSLGSRVWALFDFFNFSPTANPHRCINYTRPARPSRALCGVATAKPSNVPHHPCGHVSRHPASRYGALCGLCKARHRPSPSTARRGRAFRALPLSLACVATANRPPHRATDPRSVVYRSAAPRRISLTAVFGIFLAHVSRCFWPMFAAEV